MSAYLVVVDVGLVDCPAFASRDVAEAFVDRCREETAGNVGAVVMEHSAAYNAPAMLKALDRILCAWNDGDLDTDAMFDAMHNARQVYKAAHGESAVLQKRNV